MQLYYNVMENNFITAWWKTPIQIFFILSKFLKTRMLGAATSASRACDLFRRLAVNRAWWLATPASQRIQAPEINDEPVGLIVVY